MNTILEGLKGKENFKLTENGGVAYKSTLNDVYDMFALCGAYRSRSDEDCILMFKNAFEQDRDLALKCLFYIADCRGGQGERRFFRVCFKWFAKEYPDIAKTLIEYIPVYRRWDDVIYSCFDTPIWDDAMNFIKGQLYLDMESSTPSLLGKWMPSENASSRKTRRMANAVRSHMGLTNKQYRKNLSALRAKINIVERLMSENRWDEIEFDKIPSRAGLIYKNAFARRDIIKERYTSFAKDTSTKVNAEVLYPYEVVQKAIDALGYNILFSDKKADETDAAIVEKYWNCLPDYFNGAQSNILCVVDTSGSMHGTPINVAISLGLYCAERAGGPFKDHYISFASRPQLIKTEGVNFVDKVKRIYKTNLCDNTNLTAVFDLLLDVMKDPSTNKEDLPDTICIISDMEIDDARGYYSFDNSAEAEMEKVRKRWSAAGFKLPKLVYWNVDARQNTILDKGPGISLVSGFSPTIFEQVIKGVTGMDLMLDKLNSERYANIHA